MADEKWQKAMNIMTPEHLDDLGGPDYQKIADCLGIGPRYKVSFEFIIYLAKTCLYGYN